MSGVAYRGAAITGLARYAEDRDMQFERARAWRCDADATVDDTTLLREAADRVEAIIRRFGDDRDLLYELEEVLHCLVARPRSDSEVLGFWHRLQDLCRRFPDDPEFAELLNVTLLNLRNAGMDPFRSAFR